MDANLHFTQASSRMGVRAQIRCRRGLLAAALVGGLAAASCDAEVATPRGQILVVIDTDLPIVGQLADRPELSPAAAIDSVRVDAFRDDGTREDFLDVVVPDVEDWPLSFGIASGGKRSIRIQIRAFKAAYADRGELNGRDTLEPRPELTIDRVVDIPLPSEGVQRVVVRLAGDCLGVRPVFDAATQVVTSCIDGMRPSGSPSEGIEEYDELAASVVGTWEPAIEKPCAEAEDETRACIEGGFMLLGDDAFDGFEDGIDVLVASSPVRPVVMSPFFMDRTELTAGRLDALLAEGKVTLAVPPRRFDASSPLDRLCTWGGANPRLPLNCVTLETAKQICVGAGGELPSEAQWEFAARGRGLGRVYPWGDAPPQCCSAAVDLNGAGTCGTSGPREVGAFTGADGCMPADVSRDGLVDLAGNLAEMTRDSTLPYDDPCWASPAVLRDPFCESSAIVTHVSRGGSWSGKLEKEPAVIRTTAFTDTDFTGFRCVYRGAR